jgi:tRNA threonylcarbamoyladenosine biosynthesis protein TsaE
MTHCVGFQLADEAATVKMGNQLAMLMEQGAVIYLHGDLGAGKTTYAGGAL